MERYVCDAPHVVADRRQDSARTNAARESLVKRAPLCFCGWLTTTAMPYEERFFEMEFDFIDHNLVTKCSDGTTAIVPLAPKSVATFYQETMDALSTLGIEAKIWKTPVEIADPIPFDQDEQHASYDQEYVERFWRVLRSSERVMQEFRSRFIGKCSPVHFFWGS